MINIIAFTHLSNTFNAVQENATQIWRFKYFKLVYEYYLCANYRIFPLPPPLNLIDICMLFMRSIKRTLQLSFCFSKKKHKKL